MKLELLKNEQLSADITEAKLNFEMDKASKLKDLQDEKELLVLSFKDADPSTIPSLIKDMIELEKTITFQTNLTADDLTPKRVLLFNGKLYESGKETVKRVKGVGKFNVGQKVRMVSGEHQSEIYTVGEDSNVYSQDHIPYKASILTKKFNCETLGKPDNGWDMAGLSHHFWVSAE
jgi:hypothetical protein